MVVTRTALLAMAAEVWEVAMGGDNNRVMVVAGWSSCMRGLRLLLAWRVTEAWVMMGGGV